MDKWLSSRPYYFIWGNMKDRCYNTKCKDYPHYGGRGITVCSEWLNDYRKFEKDMGIRPANYTVNRVDNNKNYTKENCVWSSVSDQNINRSTIIKAKGYRERNGKFEASVKSYGKTKSKTFLTEGDAKAWYEANKKVVKQ